jgi:hypothetical protein
VSALGGGGGGLKPVFTCRSAGCPLGEMEMMHHDFVPSRVLGLC